LRIPNADRGVIEAAKVHDYLLSRTHPVGRFKAAFFLALGCSPYGWRPLEADLRSQHLSQDAVSSSPETERHRAMDFGRASPRACLRASSSVG
jgi:hypothetical protein